MNFYMQYTDTDDSFEIGQECTVFYEIINNYVERQVLLAKDKLVGSNRKDKMLDYFLSECSITPDDFDIEDKNFKIITKIEFEEIWDKHCNLYKEEWNYSKNKFKIGMEVKGEVEVIYPQGIIIKLNETTLAITDYDKCLRNSPVTSIYPNQYISGKVKEYDEKNMWIVIEMSKVII
ncbi:hypothetical protein SAMN02745163_02971 [Clostridium cavendishii DSM 21758]|uniref:S1 motif domain-containing protein n=1 Tax=Clostridium cavendishii DSM 21758 TaxID=1121302 RepID=A0A1M6NPH2_9CLOT|nr:hypothetical protein [Clostridium cavendishii]SHJ97637.1 hypothetical protein SAMN02745163_02971 [Clostridium cavendishii DSM 21758]